MPRVTRRSLALVVALAATLAGIGSAEAQGGAHKGKTAERGAHEATHEKKARAGSAKAEAREARGKTGKARTIGAPNRGKIEGAIRLKPNRHLRTREGAHTWGLPALTRLLKRAADRVATRHKRSVLVVGDLSARGGGPLTGHNSHQSGRDADIGFYVTNSKGKPVEVRRFIAFDDTGKGREVDWARFDDARNWTLVEALLKDEAGVRYIFVDNALRARLLAYAAKKKVNKDLYTRAAFAMLSPRDADVHDNHFHVRIACPEGMRECIEESGPRRGSDAPGDPAPAGDPAAPIDAAVDEHPAEPGVEPPAAAEPEPTASPSAAPMDAPPPPPAPGAKPNPATPEPPAF